jgi:hypothetical protein
VCSQLSGNAGERSDRIGVGRSGQEQRKDEVDLLTIDCTEVNRAAESHDHAERLLGLGNSRVRNSDTTPIAVDPSSSRFRSAGEIWSAGRFRIDAAF